MPRNQRKRLGSRSYANYSVERLDECLRAIRSRKFTQRAAAVEFGIPRSTIKNKLKGNHDKPIGRSRIFTDAEEIAFEQHLMKLSDYGFPVVESDFRMAVKSFLDKKGTSVCQFKENLPGYDWTKSFLQRHANLSIRISSNIKKVRAQVGVNEINDYMDHLRVSIQDVPPSRIWNYDETNLSDDPGNKKVICKRGAKYVEKICNFSKSSTSLMFCGNAEGKCIPPYVVYKAEHIWSTWRENGPANTRYNRSKSGWFDGICFEDWFESQFLKEVRHETGPVVLIGDNLSSHISLRVLQLCEEHNIRFVCLPPNTTHITQPLDVAFFGPMKRVWRGILTKWKETKIGSKYPTIPKDIFPTLLKELMNTLQPTMEQNLMSGFKKSGIYPLNKQILLDRLPENLTQVDNSIVGDAFLEQLDKKRAEFLSLTGNKRRKKLQVPPGKSITCEDVEATTGSSKPQPQIVEAIPGSSKPQSQAVHVIPDSSKPSCFPKTRRYSLSSSSEDNDSDEMLLESEELSDEVFSDLENNSKDANNSINLQKLKPEQYVVDNFVIISFNGSKYPGKVVKISQDGATVDCMEKGLKCWRWPARKDCDIYDWKDVLGKIEPPRMISKRNQYAVPELEDFV